jgi:Na+/melibiose symporter-like transporter
MLVFGIILNITGFGSNTLKIFFFLYALFSAGIGIILPTWQNYLVNIYSEDKIMAGHSVMWIFQSIGKFLSGFVILKIISRYSFSSEGAGLIFSLVGITFIAGSMVFLVTKEIPRGSPDIGKQPVISKKHRFKTDLRSALHNRNFLLLVASDLELFALISIFSFYANYAADYCGIEPRIAAGVFVILSYLGMITINIIYGNNKNLSLKQKYMASKAVSLLSALILLFFTDLWAFLAASFFMGVSRGARSLVYMPTIKKISGMDDSTNFFGIVPILTMPLSTGLPLLSGAFLDHFSSLGANSYRLFFLTMILFIAAGILLLKKTKIPDFSSRGLCLFRESSWKRIFRNLK